MEVSENCTFDDIHDAIFNAFDRHDHHLYSFFITRKDTTNMHSIYDAPEITHPQNVEGIMGFGKKKKSTAKTRIGDIGLNENDVFHYLFDFGMIGGIEFGRKILLKRNPRKNILN